LQIASDSLELAMTEVLTALQDAVAGAAAAAGPSVVGLGRGWGRGSGVVVAPGAVLTVAHALRGEQVAVTFRDGRTGEGRLDGVDADAGLARVAVETDDAPAIAWEPAAADGLSAGAGVVALADPGGRGLRASLGFVTATGLPLPTPGRRGAARAIEHGAPLPRGSSGAPLVDPEGRLLGLNAIRREGGLILALSAGADLRRRVDALARGEAPARPRLGVALAPARVARRMRAAVGLPERDGLLVRAVESDGPAAAAGVQRGDLLVRAGDAPLASVDDLFDALEGAAEGGELRLGVVRGSDERDVAVRLRG
jgi:serine protease Do